MQKGSTLNEKENCHFRADTIAAEVALDGGKGAFNGKLARWIISLMPPRDQWLHYVEPYAGGLSVLLANNPEGISEVANDIHQDLTTFWRVLQKPDEFYSFQRVIEATPFSEEEFNIADVDHDRCPSNVEVAVGFFIRCRQSLSGRMKDFATISRNRTRRGMNEQVSAWLSCVEGLPEVHERLKRVLVLNRNALDVIREQDGEKTLFYLDPPYLHETRATTGEYEHEMSYADHRALLEVLKSIKGKFLLSGYDSDLYRGYSQTTPIWDKQEFQIVNNASGGKEKREMTECIWRNF